MSDSYSGSNRSYGSAKRKRSGGVRSASASKLSRRMFGHRVAPQLSAAVFDKAVGRALKARHIEAPEQKYLETIFENFEVLSTPTITLLNGLQVGTTDNTRIGNKIRVTKVELIMTMIMSATNSLGGRDQGKLALFIHKDANGDVPLFENGIGTNTDAVYTSNGGIGGLSLKNANNESQFYIIKDWDWVLDATAGVSGAWQRNTLKFKCNIPINRITQYNNSDAGTIADIEKNALYLGWAGSTVTGATATVASGIVRVFYTDM